MRRRPVVAATGLLTVATMISLLLAGVASPDASRRSGGASVEASRAAIAELLLRQETAWNAGDLEGFLEGYARRGDLVFASGGKFTTGWDSLAARYRRRYATRQAMGTLRFSLERIDVLAPRLAKVLGRWELQRDDHPRGLFTLVLVKEESGWAILHDHTSLARP